jgi:intracellular septation protein A
MKTTAFARFLSLQRTLALTVLAPIGIFQTATAQGVPELQGLLLAAIAPLANIAWSLVRARRLDPIGALSLVAIVGGAAASLVLNDPRVLLVKESIVTALLGVACLASLLTSRPLLVLLAPHFGTSREQLASPGAQAAIRRLTLVWGVAFVAEASLRVALSFVLEPALLVLASPILAAAVFGPLGLWTLYRARRPVQLGQPRPA